MIEKLWDVFVEEDATLVEVNPLVRLGDGTLEALDGKVTLDENADFRHPDHAAFEDKAPPTRSRPRPRRRTSTTSSSTARSASSATAPAWSCPPSTSSRTPARTHGGVKPANFLDIGGGASAEVMANGLDIILGDPQVEAVFVNVFGGITACDAVANGIVQALEHARATRPTKPLVVRLDGNNVEEGRRILDRGQPPAGDAWSTPWTARPTGPPSWPRRAEEDETTWRSS